MKRLAGRGAGRQVLGDTKQKGLGNARSIGSEGIGFFCFMSLSCALRISGIGIKLILLSLFVLLARGGGYLRFCLMASLFPT